MLDKILEKFGDHGAESSRRDRFQEHYAASWCIKMLSDPSISEVICEYGEDVVITRNGAFELFQVKTKQESVDNWKLQDLIPIISKTFAMVPYFGTVSRCYFVSNAGAKGILYQLKTVLNQPQETWDISESEFFEDVCKNHGKSIFSEIQRIDPESKTSIDEIRTMLLKLDILTDYHHMDYVEDTNLRELREYLEGNSQPSIVFSDTDLQKIYDRLLGVVGKATIGRTKPEKTLNKKLVVECVSQARHKKTLYSFPTKEAVDKAPGKTLLEKKLSLGGFTPLFIQTAREEMVSVMSTTRSWNFGHTSEILEDIKFRTRHLCIDKYDKVCSNHTEKADLGREILEEIKKELPSLISYYQRTDLPFIDEIFLEGIAMLLTSECKFYWSQHQRM